MQKDDIEGLAGVYRDSTSLIPGAGDGPFAKFVKKFLNAFPCFDNLKYESVVDAIKNAQIAVLMRPTARESGSPPFGKCRGGTTLRVYISSSSYGGSRHVVLCTLNSV